MKKTAIFITLMFLSLCFTGVLYAHKVPKGAVAFEESKNCASCHEAIYKEWSASMHAKSSPFVDKAHGAVQKKFAASMKKAGKKKYYPCGACHIPMAKNLAKLKTGEEKLTGKAWEEIDGVGCAFCHRVESLSGRSYTINKDGAYASKEKASGKAPHKTVTNNLFSSGAMCMGCHGTGEFSAKNPGCVTAEGEAIDGTGDSNCLECHMKSKKGAPAAGSSKKTHSSHEMLGGHSVKVLKEGVSFDAEVKTVDGKKQLVVNIKNNMPHSFPYSNPLRMAFVKVVAKNGKGKTVWENFKKTPLKDKRSLFFMAFKRGKEVGVPAWRAKGVAFDSRLKAGENLSLSYPLSRNDIKTVTVKLIYRLFPAKAIKKLAIPKDGINNKNHVLYKKEIQL